MKNPVATKTGFTGNFTCFTGFTDFYRTYRKIQDCDMPVKYKNIRILCYSFIKQE